MNILLRVTVPEIPEDFNINSLNKEVAWKLFKKLFSRRPDYHNWEKICRSEKTSW